MLRVNENLHDMTEIISEKVKLLKKIVENPVGGPMQTSEFCHKKIQIVRTKQTRKKARKYIFNEVRQLPTSLIQLINSCYNQ